MVSSIFFLLCFIGLSHENTQKIFKGMECIPHSQPWQVGLFEGTQLRCGGVLIDRRWILTAAHCSASRYWLSLGEHSLSQLDWTEQIRHSGLSVTHPGYQAALQNHDNDLRLLQTSCQTDSNALTSLSSLMPPAGQRSPGESRTTWCVLPASLGRMPARGGCPSLLAGAPATVMERTLKESRPPSLGLVTGIGALLPHWSGPQPFSLTRSPVLLRWDWSLVPVLSFPIGQGPPIVLEGALYPA
ncbi:kallikrein-12 isoform X3 [Physeter macrocephalus]|uniref:Kallikrein-12 isoform X3 n=1 Tax=Physeter macrocephalus TaxID=9755 RepID=A0A9W2W7G4_PHYMC|nr:kallikrein-12 isoform X3 [Physeter catodon]